MDDVGFLAAVVDDLAAKIPVDRGRIYAIGHSNGSMMAYRFAAERPDLVTAIVAVAGAMDVVLERQVRDVAVLHIHSIDDPRALYDGGVGPPFPGTDNRVEHQPVMRGLAAWAANNGCASDPRVVDVREGSGAAQRGRRRQPGGGSQTATHLVYDGCRENGVVEHLRLTAVNMAAAKVASGEAGLAIGGGVESMSRVPMGSDGGAWPTDPSSAFKTYFAPQGVSADLIATLYGFSRDDVDAYAVESQKRAAAAWADGRFKKSVIPVKDQLGLTLLDHDETVRGSTTMQTLASLNPSFTGMGEMAFDAVVTQRYPQVERVNHVHHAGNSSGIVDGAAGVLIGTKEMGEALGLKPRARDQGRHGLHRLGALDHAHRPGRLCQRKAAEEGRAWRSSDIDLYELNEAFAAVVLRMMQALDIPHEKMNVNGGSIAMGHPLGATGAMILGTVLDELERTGQVHRAGHPLRGRRHGHRHGHRTRLTFSIRN